MLLLTSLFFLCISYTVSNFIHAIISVYGEFSDDCMDYRGHGIPLLLWISDVEGAV